MQMVKRMYDERRQRVKVCCEIIIPERTHPALTLVLGHSLFTMTKFRKFILTIFSVLRDTR